MILAQLLESVRQIEGDLFVTDLGEGREVIFSLPSIHEAMQLERIRGVIIDTGNLSLLPSFHKHIFDRYVSDSCIIKSQQNIQAGIQSTIAELILSLSGSPEEGFIEYTNFLLETYRSSIETIKSFMKRTICGTFSGYKFSDLEALNYQRLVEVFANAEQYRIENGIIKERCRIEKSGNQDQPSIGNMINQDIQGFKELDKTPPVKDPKMEEFLRQRALARSRRGG